MAVPRETVQHMARLAHLELTEPEIAQMAIELSSIIEHVDRLQEVDVTTAHAAGLSPSNSNVMRDDMPRQSWTVEQALANAPRRHEDYFEVEAVLD